MVTVFSLIYLAVMVFLCIGLKNKANAGEKNWGVESDEIADSFPYLFSILFLALSVTVFVLIKKLKMKNDYMVIDDATNNYFKKEIDTLSVILILFSASYLLRVLYDVVLGFWQVHFTFSNYMVGAASVMPFDLIPLIVVMLFHRANLKAI